MSCSGAYISRYGNFCAYDNDTTDYPLVRAHGVITSPADAAADIMQTEARLEALSNHQRKKQRYTEQN